MDNSIHIVKLDLFNPLTEYSLKKKKLVSDDNDNDNDLFYYSDLCYNDFVTSSIN